MHKKCQEKLGSIFKNKLLTTYINSETVFSYQDQKRPPWFKQTGVLKIGGDPRIMNYDLGS